MQSIGPLLHLAGSRLGFAALDSAALDSAAPYRGGFRKTATQKAPLEGELSASAD